MPALSGTKIGIKDFYLEQVQSQRSVTGAQFNSGPQVWEWTASGNEVWIPMYSYFRVRCRLQNATGPVQLLDGDDTAPAMGLIDNLYQNMRMEIQGVQVQRIDNNVPQAAAIEIRTKKRRAWLESMGKDTGLWHSSQVRRKTVVVSDPTVNPGNDAVGVETDNNLGQEFELIWRPPMSIMDIEQGLHSARFRITANAISAGLMNTAAIEMDRGTAGAAISEFEITDMFFYAAKAEGPNVDNQSYSLDLQNLQIQTNTINTFNTSQRDFTVPKSTFQLGVAYQSLLAETDRRLCGTKFVSGLTVASGDIDFDERKLNDFYIQYDGQQRPRPNADPSFVDTLAPSPHRLTNFMTQRYYENQLYNGSQFGEGGGERMNEWLERGIYMVYPWPRDGRSESDRVIVRSGFSGAFVGDDGMQILLFAWWRSHVTVQVSEGRTTVVVAEDF